MVEMFDAIRALIESGNVVVSRHGYTELKADEIEVSVAENGVNEAVVVEEYPEYYRGPCVLVRQPDLQGGFLHVLWGVRNDKRGPAVLITAYRPDPRRWSPDFLRRLT